MLYENEIIYCSDTDGVNVIFSAISQVVKFSQIYYDPHSLNDINSA